MVAATGDERKRYSDPNPFRLQECLQFSRTLLPLVIPQRTGSPRRGFARRSIQQLVDENTSRLQKTAPIQLDTGTVQGSVLPSLLFDLFLNALLPTGITHGNRRTPQWNHAAFADDLSIYVCTVRDANKLLDVIHEFEFWSGLRISIPKSLATGAMYGTGSERQSERAKIDVAKRKRDAGTDVSNPQIQALGAMDEALDVDNTLQVSTKGQEAW